MNTAGKILVEQSANADTFAELIGALNLTPPVLIKPNWGTVECYSEADVLDWTLSAIQGEKIVIESHGWARNEETLLGKESGKLTRANLRKGDQWFLDHCGLGDVLAKHDVEYLNLTEEIWAGRAADPEQVKQVVEQRYAPVRFEEMYAKVPARLFEMRGGTLLSLAKYKILFYPLGVSFSIKNLFGLLPGPSRGKYHGEAHADLDQSIVDINKIYRSLFNLKGMIETTHNAGLLENDVDRTIVRPGCGEVLASDDTVTLDAFASALYGRDPASVGHLRLAAETFGDWDPSTVAAAVSSGLTMMA